MQVFFTLLIFAILIGAVYLIKIKIDEGTLTEKERSKKFNDVQIKVSSIAQTKKNNEKGPLFYIGRCFIKYGVFDGVAGKAEFWWFYLFFTILSVASYFIDLNLMNSETGFSFFSAIMFLILFLPMISVSTRRLHDIGRSGWWQLIALTGIGVFILLIWYASGTNDQLNRRFK
jgi:uncharacterized membrane protein YhaH (DUF805 family)